MRPFLVLLLLAFVPAALAATTASPLDSVCLETTTGTRDATADARDPGEADVLLGRTRDPGVGTHVAYFGAKTPFSGLRFVLSVPGSRLSENVLGVEDTGTPDFAAYVKPGIWETIPVVDGTDGLAKGGDVRSIHPWGFVPRPADLGCIPGGHLVLRMSWSSPHVTPPLAAQVMALR